MRRIPYRTLVITIAWLVACNVGHTLSAQSFGWNVVAKARTDECFNGFGNNYVSGPSCSGNMLPKKNQSYLWGMTNAGVNIWIGTGANVICQQLTSTAIGATFEIPAIWVCEGVYSKFPGLSFVQKLLLGDWRPPKIYHFKTTTKVLTNLTPNDSRLSFTAGLRSAGSNDGVVLFAGPTTLGIGVNMFAFDANTAKFIGSTTKMLYKNIRKWVVVDGHLYTAVGNTFGGGGAVLKWVGNTTNPFQFVTVGNLDTEGAELVAHNGRLYVGTWTNAGATVAESAPAGIYQSPVLPVGGLTAANANSWQKVWSSSDFDPDPVVALGYGVGGMASYGGYLYWGTLHPFGIGYTAFTAVYGTPGNQDDQQESVANSQRATSLFRVTDFDTATEQLLYGNSLLPRYTPGAGGAYGTWVDTPNKLGVAPKYGPAGYGDPLNIYTWSMSIYNDKLFLGTYDIKQGVPTPLFGGDLYYFPNSNSGAIPVNTSGLGNPANAGLRNMLTTSLGLYVGTANMLNIHPDGGWELIQVVEH